MSIVTRVLAAASALTLVGCATMSDRPTERLGGATISLASGVPAGTAQLLANADTVTLAVALTGLAPGAHGIHLHSAGSCTAPDFASAGGHLNPLDRRHGTLNPAGKHAGDLPNITIKNGGSGSLAAELTGTRAQILDWLFDTDGTAIVVHADADDYATDPSGSSGARVACGIFKRG